MAGRVVEGGYKHRGPVLSAAFSSDGSKAVTGSQDGTAKVWDLDNQADGIAPGRLAVLWHKGPVESVAFSPDGNLIVTGSTERNGGGSARIWALVETFGNVELCPPLLHEQAVKAVAFSPDGRVLVTGSLDGSARLWQVSAGELHGKPQRPEMPIHPASGASTVGLLGFSPGQGPLLAASVLLARRAGTAVHALAFAPDWRTVLAEDDQRSEEVSVELHLLPLGAGKAAGASFELKGPLADAVFSHDGRMVLTGTGIQSRKNPGEGWGQAQLWDTGTGKVIGSPLKHAAPVKAVAFSPDGSVAATCEVMEDETGKARSQISLWDTPAGRRRARSFLLESEPTVLIFSPDGKTLLTLTGRGSDPLETSVDLWEVATDTHRELHLRSGGATVVSAAFSPDGRTLLTGTDEDVAQGWDLFSGRALGPALHHRVGGFVRQEEGLLPRNYGGSAPFFAEFSSDGRMILTCRGDGTVRLWDARTGQPVGPPFWPRTEILKVGFVSGCKIVAIGATDGTVRMWGIPDAVEGTPEQIAIWTQVVTGMELGEDGA
jgi:WD40 repeat protein